MSTTADLEQPSSPLSTARQNGMALTHDALQQHDSRPGSPQSSAQQTGNGSPSHIRSQDGDDQAQPSILDYMEDQDNSMSDKAVQQQLKSQPQQQARAVTFMLEPTRLRSEVGDADDATTHKPATLEQMMKSARRFTSLHKRLLTEYESLLVQRTELSHQRTKLESRREYMLESLRDIEQVISPLRDVTGGINNTTEPQTFDETKRASIPDKDDLQRKLEQFDTDFRAFQTQEKDVERMQDVAMVFETTIQNLFDKCGQVAEQLQRGVDDNILDDENSTGSAISDLGEVHEDSSAHIPPEVNTYFYLLGSRRIWHERLTELEQEREAELATIVEDEVAKMAAAQYDHQYNEVHGEFMKAERGAEEALQVCLQLELDPEDYRPHHDESSESSSERSGRPDSTTRSTSVPRKKSRSVIDGQITLPPLPSMEAPDKKSITAPQSVVPTSELAPKRLRNWLAAVPVAPSVDAWTINDILNKTGAKLDNMAEEDPFPPFQPPPGRQYQATDGDFLAKLDSTLRAWSPQDALVALREELAIIEQRREVDVQ